MDKFTVYGRSGCSYCHQAVNQLEKAGYPFDYIDIYKQGLSKQDVSERIKQPVYSMPQIQHGDKYLGGYMELLAYLRTI